MNYNSDLPGGKQATKGDKKLTVIYYMDYRVQFTVLQNTIYILCKDSSNFCFSNRFMHKKIKWVLSLISFSFVRRFAQENCQSKRNTFWKRGNYQNQPSYLSAVIEW
jgi:hypothetical protein